MIAQQVIRKGTRVVDGDKTYVISAHVLEGHRFASVKINKGENLTSWGLRFGTIRSIHPAMRSFFCSHAVLWRRCFSELAFFLLASMHVCMCSAPGPPSRNPPTANFFACPPSYFPGVATRTILPGEYVCNERCLHALRHRSPALPDLPAMHNFDDVIEPFELKLEAFVPAKQVPLLPRKQRGCFYGFPRAGNRGAGLGLQGCWTGCT